MAWNGQLSMQAPHLMHLAWSITCFCLIVPVMALTGQLRAHFVQPLQASVMTSLKSFRQVPAGHFLSRTWAMYSSLK